MKVRGPGQTQGPSKTKKANNSGDTSSEGFDEFMTSAPQKAAPPTTTQSIAKVDSLLAVQATENPTERAAKKRVKQRGNTILDELEKIRMAMLGGRLTVGHMIDIADVVASHREKITDPALTAIMDEVDLRAQVELAKMRAAIDRANQGAKAG